MLNCPECKKKMNLIKEWDSSKLYKCSKCGHLTLIDGLKKQDWSRNDVR